MPPQLRFGAPNNLPPHYPINYPAHSQAQAHAGNILQSSFQANPAVNFMNQNTLANPFSTNGNALGMAGGFGGSGLGMNGGTGLASQAAQMSFAGALSHSEAGSRGGGNKGRIRDVWKGNLDEEMALLRKLVDKYQYISMDTEFPGLVARPMGAFRGKSDYHYQTLRCNVDMLKIIQLGITLFSEEGKEIPPSELESDLPTHGQRRNGNPVPLPCTWQFNFKFSIKDDMYAEASIESLRQAGLDFVSIERDGIDPSAFAAQLISSGLVCDEDVHWISFHGGYDFGYLTKLLICQPLPDDEAKFMHIMEKFFPSTFDIKYLLKTITKQHNMGGNITPLDSATQEILAKFDQRSSLENASEVFKVKRVGIAHSAGSDSLLTGRVFFRMREKVFNGEIPGEMVSKVWGLGFPDNNFAPHHFHAQQENTTPSHNGYSNGTPSTPNTGNAALVSTPAHINNGGGPLTPGGISFGGGAFGGFMANNNGR